jgi:hypothetical protein
VSGWPKTKRPAGFRLKELIEKFDPAMMAAICEEDENNFAGFYDMERVEVDQPAPHNFYNFLDRGSNILAVAHLDTVASKDKRKCRFVDTEGAGPIVVSRALDDRIGAYSILEWLPALGFSPDVLLTVGEESGKSTAGLYEPYKQYDWIIEFDRGGTDVVLYCYDDTPTRKLVSDTGATVGRGSISDISYLYNCGVKAFNWGTGYRDYHTAKSHAWLADTWEMMDYFLLFLEQNETTHLPHVHEEKKSYTPNYGSGSGGYYGSGGVSGGWKGGYGRGGRYGGQPRAQGQRTWWEEANDLPVNPPGWADEVEDQREARQKGGKVKITKLSTITPTDTEALEIVPAAPGGPLAICAPHNAVPLPGMPAGASGADLDPFFDGLAEAMDEQEDEDLDDRLKTLDDFLADHDNSYFLDNI